MHTYFASFTQNCWWQNGQASEAVFDFAVSDIPVEESESESVPDQQRATTEEDLVGKCANITYNDNLLQLLDACFFQLISNDTFFFPLH